MQVSPSGTQHEIASGAGARRDRRGRRDPSIVRVGRGRRDRRVPRRRVSAPAGRGQVLAPWPNRLEDGTLLVRRTRGPCRARRARSGNAIHGLVRWLPWTLESERRTSIVPAPPARTRSRRIHGTSTSRLPTRSRRRDSRVTTQATNRSSEARPVRDRLPPVRHGRDATRRRRSTSRSRRDGAAGRRTNEASRPGSSACPARTFDFTDAAVDRADPDVTPRSPICGGTMAGAVVDPRRAAGRGACRRRLDGRGLPLRHGLHGRHARACVAAPARGSRSSR